MITLFGQSYAATAPEVLVPLLVLAVLGLMVFAVLKASARAARSHEPLLREISWMADRVEALGQGQERLAGGLHHVSDAQASSQEAMLRLMEARLAEVQNRVHESLHGSATRTARSLGELHERLQTIDRAQANLEKLSGNVLSLQDILSNKQTRGAFGEIQLHDIVGKALPRDSFTLQATLSNGKRADCLIHLPKPPGPIVIDAKFPLEAYEQLRRAETPRQQHEAGQALRQAVRVHLRAIAEKYIIEGETADGALMFLPSEAVYAELHANFPEIVREGFALKVWIVSPTTCMATLNTMRAVLKDARMREQAGAIRKELALLNSDVERLGTRVENLDRHFNMAARDIEEIRISADKAGKRARRLDHFDFEELAEPAEPQAVPVPVPVTAPPPLPAVAAARRAILQREAELPREVGRSEPVVAPQESARTEPARPQPLRPEPVHGEPVRTEPGRPEIHRAPPREFY